MPFINVEVEEAIARKAKTAAARAGMHLKHWVAQAIERCAADQDPATAKDGQIKLREPEQGRRGPDADFEWPPRGGK